MGEIEIDAEVRHVTKPEENLFADLGFPTPEAERCQVELRKKINEALDRSRREDGSPCGAPEK